MPLIKSAKKRMKQNEVRRVRRLPVKTIMKTSIRKVREAAKAGKKDDAQKLLSEAFKAIDMAAKRDIIHKKNAARKKSSLSKAVAAAA